VHGIDTSDPAVPKIVHAFMPRDTEGCHIEESWDVLGMRATRSEDTVLDGVFVPDRFVARVVPAGAAGIDAFVLGIFAWALINFGNIYYGLAQRALDLTVEAVRKKRSVAVSRTMAYHPEVQHRLAEMSLALEPLAPLLDRIADDWATGAPHGATWRGSSRPSTWQWSRAGAPWTSRSTSPVASEFSGAAASNACSAMPASAASTLPTRC
jgi:alkylation response protein AidB-like acyl-CoA dehydrogenase